VPWRNQRPPNHQFAERPEACAHSPRSTGLSARVVVPCSKNEKNSLMYHQASTRTRSQFPLYLIIKKVAQISCLRLESFDPPFVVYKDELLVFEVLKLLTGVFFANSCTELGTSGQDDRSRMPCPAQSSHSTAGLPTNTYLRTTKHARHRARE
jgi:hypothetical protein